MIKSLWPVTQQFQAKNGSNLVSGKIYIYYQGRTALATTYHDEDGKVVNSNPVLLDNNGRATVFADTAYSYTIVVCDYYGKELFSQDITLHDVTETADEITLIGSDGSIRIDTSSSNGVKTFDMSANTDILATKKSVDDLDIRVKKNEDDIKVISGNVENITAEMSGKKDRQTELNFNGSATKTVTNISQDANGEITVTYEDIDLPQEAPNVEISSEDNSVQITETTDTQTNTKTFDLSVNVDDKIPDPSTSNPLMDGAASVGSSIKYAREDHVHPSDTSKESVSNKTSVVIGTSNSKYPTDKAVADFVNSSIATNTANYISNNGEPFTSVEELEAYTGTVTNNDYAFVTGTDSEGNTYYDRYKATVSGSTVTWALEYRLNNSSFTAAQWAAINSGVTSDKANYWDGKQDALTFDGTYNGSTNKAATVSSITSRINNLDASVTSTDGTNVQVKVTETNGKISAVNVTTDNTENKNNKVSTWQATPDNTHYPSEQLVKEGLDGKADLTKSVAIFDGYMRRLNESTGWRRLAYKQFNYTNTNVNALFRLYLFGSNNDHIGLGDLLVNVRFGASGSAPVFNTCYLMSYKSLYTSVKVKVIGVAGNAVVELWFRPMTFSMLTLTCLGNGLDINSRTKDWTFGRYLDSTDPEPVEDVANNIYVFSGTKRNIQISIANPTNGNLVIMDENGLVKDSGKATSDFATKATLDSRVPAPTSTTGTQVLKCINGVIQWVNE